MIGARLELSEYPGQVRFPHVVVDLANEASEPHPDILNTIRTAIVSQRVVDHLMPVAKELSNMGIAVPSIRTDEAAPGDMLEEKTVERALFAVRNASESDLARLSGNRTYHDLLVLKASFPNESFIDFYNAIKPDAFLGEYGGKAAKPAPNRGMRPSSHRFGILQAQFGEPAMEEVPKLAVRELGMGKRSGALQGKFQPTNFTPVSPGYFSGIPALTVRAADTVGKEDLANLRPYLGFRRRVCYGRHRDIGEW